MKRRVLIICVFVLLWMALTGSWLNNADTYNVAYILGVCQLAGMSLMMMIAPAIYKIKKKPLEKSWKFCKINSIVVLVLWTIMSVILWGGIYDETFVALGGNIIYSLAFYYINTRLFFPGCKIK